MAAHKKPAAEKAVCTTVSIPAGLLLDLERAAESRSMTRSQLVCAAVAQLLSLYEQDKVREGRKDGAV